MVTTELPEDVWRCVTDALSRSERASLLSVNRALFNIVLDERYQEVRWEKLDTSMAWSLERLKAPNIARRVRRLFIRAWFIDYLIQKERLVKPASYAVPSRSWLAPLEEYLNVPPPSPSKTFSTTGDASAGDILKSMTDAVSLMHGVVEYSFEWRDLAPTPETMRFVSTARTAFGSTLRKLCLNAQLMNFSSLLSGFDHLDEIDLMFDYDQESWETAITLRRTIAPFINQFSESLRGLKIASSSKGDQAPLFYALTTLLSQLRYLSISLPFSYAKEPDAVLAMLRNHTTTLRELEIIRLPGLTTRSQSSWPQLSTALASESIAFAVLQRLTLSPLATFDHTLACLRHAADTLTHITLVDLFLDLTELEQVLRMFVRRPLDGGLEKLHIGLKTLSLRMFELLVKYAPALHTLYLVLPEERSQELYGWGQHGTSTDHAVDTLMTGLETVTLDWRLRDIGVWDRRFLGATAAGSPTVRESKVSELLMLRIRSVRLVRGVRYS
ncbi:hypothetical protein MIND_01311500 [Mycena indigotica]|uniref:F-box domain-containing protein n=1 Tax=Mycena indigotica TaxID=2126181 RepID=A0A8H6S1Q0_9AGAR|nr:uncharacterized protein MIND_01311500 [Mycena indigotica]KAF7290708.1 hypothetical protein MIND_01311500 [Mycena indigotica]